MKRIIFSLLLAIFLVTGCDKKDGEVSTAGSPVVTRPTRDDLRASAKDAAKQIVVKKEIETKVVNLFSAGLSTKDGKKVDPTKLGGNFQAYYKNRRRVTDFYALHLGLPSMKNGVYLLDEIEISFDANMAKFWHTKVSKENVSDSTLGKAPEILERYMKTDRGYTTLPEFIKHVDGVVSQAKQSLDWKKLCERYGLIQKVPTATKKGNKGVEREDDSRCRVLRGVVSNLHGKDFIAYGMTELFPNDARFNVLYLDMLLKNAGASYIMNIPAMHDNMLSLGFYQFTSFSVRRDEEGIEGASIVSGFAKDGGVKIPDSVAYLVGDHHHVAALYFAIHNIAKMVKPLSSGSVKNLLAKHDSFQDEMLMFVAAAHHLPSKAWKQTRRWIEGKMRGNLIRMYHGSGNYGYAIKTQANLIALNEKFPQKR